MRGKRIVVLTSTAEMAEFVTSMFRELIATKRDGEFLTLALSGGKTPERIFENMSSHPEEFVFWKRIRFFWVDERCVSPDDNESNFRMARLSLLENLDIPSENIYRIFGESDPFSEVVRYSRVISGKVPAIRNLPRFDLVLLGLGVDGHTASIFPGHLNLFQSINYCDVTVHPQTGQRRISLTGPVINNAKNVVFIVTGPEKAKIVADVLNDQEPGSYPASLVNPACGILIWLLDEDAAGLLNSGKSQASGQD
jgi:6-phosphogluconolactonase